MPLYRYRAIDPAGYQRIGRMDAGNPGDLELRLKRIELDLIDGQPIDKHFSFGADSLPRRELLHFCFHLDMLTRAGIPLLDGLTDLRDSTDNRRLRGVVANLIEAIEDGEILSQAMSAQPRVFGEVFINLISAGESAGRLPDILASLVEALKWEDELIAQTQKILVYPLMVGSIVLSAACFLMAAIVPQLKTFITAMGQELPIQTQALFFVSDALIAYWYAFLLVPVAGVSVAQVVLRIRPESRLYVDGIKLRLPLLGGILRKIILSRFAKTFALLYAAGIPIIEAIHASQKIVGNLVVQRRLEHVERSINEGASITTAFHDAGFFPPLLIRMIRIGEHTGALDNALLNVSYFYSRDIRESVEKGQQLIDPILTVLLGGLLGWIMLSVLGPVYDLVGSIQP